MKKILLILSLLSGFTACQKMSELQPVSPMTAATGDLGINKPIHQFDPVGHTLSATGVFMSNAHPTSGGVRLYQKGEKYTLVFENFKTDNGPDLRIYLSEDRVASKYIEVSPMVNSGDYFIELPSRTDPKAYKYVLIWCKSFSVLFGNAELKY